MANALWMNLAIFILNFSVNDGFSILEAQKMDILCKLRIFNIRVDFDSLVNIGQRVL